LVARSVQPHIPVIDRRHQTGGRFTRDQIRFEAAENAYYCPEGKSLRHRGPTAHHARFFLLFDDRPVPGVSAESPVYASRL
jgi:hypothetical protein